MKSHLIRIISCHLPSHGNKLTNPLLSMRMLRLQIWSPVLNWCDCGVARVGFKLRKPSSEETLQNYIPNPAWTLLESVSAAFTWSKWQTYVYFSTSSSNSLPLIIPNAFVLPPQGTWLGNQGWLPCCHFFFMWIHLSQQDPNFVHVSLNLDRDTYIALGCRV